MQVGRGYGAAHEISAYIEGKIFGEWIGDKTVGTRDEQPTGPDSIIYNYTSNDKLELKQGIKTKPKEQECS